MSALLIVICVLAALLAIGVVLYLVTARRYQSSGTVAYSYDRWTEDGILEFYWGEHIHLGHYGSPPKRKDFLKAKEDFIHEMVRWGGRSHFRRGTTVLDVGCGIGGSSRVLARDYGCEVTGVTISPSQIKRAWELTPPELPVRFLVDDAMELSFPDASFDVVWSVKGRTPHARQGSLCRRADAGAQARGILVLADWNQRDDRAVPLNFWEKPVMRQLLDQWSHPAFASVEGFSELLDATGLVEGGVETADWTRETLPSWMASIWQGVLRPEGLLRFGLLGLIKSLREVPTFLLMRLAFGRGLCRYGVFRARRAAILTSSGRAQSTTPAQSARGQ